MAEYDKSNLTQRAFAEREGIRYNTFTTWLMHRRLKVAKSSNNFAEVPPPTRFYGYSDPIRLQHKATPHTWVYTLYR